MDKYAIYGAGNIGERAYKYYGSHNISFFIDKSLDKQKKGYLGKNVFDVHSDEVKKYDGRIIIAVNDELREEIENILIECGLKDYLFFDGVRKARIQEYFSNNQISKYKIVGIYGTGKDAEFLYKYISNDLKYTGEIIFVDRSELVLSEDTKAYQLEDAVNMCEALIIGSEKYHLSIELRIERYLDSKQIKIPILSPFKLINYYSPNLLIFDKYKEGQEAVSEEEMIASKKNSTYAIEKLKDYVKEAKINTPLFNSIEIETYNKCNGVCEFCPVNVRSDTREHIFMSESLFMKIVRELEEIEYSGRISLFSNNEPLLDDRIFDFSRILRQKLPKAKIHMFTNGTLFTIEKFQNLIPELDELIIDNYNQNLQLIKPVREIKEYCESNPELISKVSIVLRKPKEILTTRGGEAPNRGKKEIYKGVPCQFPYRQMVIRPDGCISLCCNDPLGRNTLGNVNNESLLEIWYGEKYIHVRDMISKGRENYEYCMYCDVFSCYL